MSVPPLYKIFCGLLDRYRYQYAQNVKLSENPTKNDANQDPLYRIRCPDADRSGGQ